MEIPVEIICGGRAEDMGVVVWKVQRQIKGSVLARKKQRRRGKKQ